MIRKSVLLAITFTVVTLPAICRAQTQQVSVGSAIELARADMQADRAMIVTAAMNFSDKEGAAFWPIYRKYEYDRSTLDDRRAAVIKDYAAKYSTLTDAEAKAMFTTMVDCESGLTALKKKYFNKFNAVLPALTVTKFFQLDHRIDLLMDMKVESSLPPLFGTQQPAAPAEPQDDQQLVPRVN